MKWNMGKSIKSLFYVDCPLKPGKHILPVIIVAQFAGTSLWFAGNAIIPQLALQTGLGPEIVGYVLSSVQLGFIMGTLLFALLMVADRYSPSKVFLVCGLLGALCNLGLLLPYLNQWSLLSVRFGTGFFLAGIYPVGMKIAADYYEKGLGRALGYLVGALVFGTAFPYLLGGTPWGQEGRTIVLATSFLAAFGALLIAVFVPNGPFRKPSARLKWKAAPGLFRIKGFRKAAFGYFGHMWELYAFWAFVPVAISFYNQHHAASLSIPLFTGIIIALGGVSCMAGGLLSLRLGSGKVARSALFVSGLCCLLSPWFFVGGPFLFIVAWCLWGMAVTADSPQFSSLVASALPAELKGTGLTLVNSMGFALSIVSIQILSYGQLWVGPRYMFLILALGPIFGLWRMGNGK